MEYYFYNSAGSIVCLETNSQELGESLPNLINAGLELLIN